MIGTGFWPLLPDFGLENAGGRRSGCRSGCPYTPFNARAKVSILLS